MWPAQGVARGIHGNVEERPELSHPLHGASHPGLLGVVPDARCAADAVMRQPRWSMVPCIHDVRCAAAAAAPCANRGGPSSPSSPHPRRPAGRLRSHRSEMSCSVGGERAAARVIPHVEGVPCGAVSGADTGSGKLAAEQRSAVALRPRASQRRTSDLE